MFERKKKTAKKKVPVPETAMKDEAATVTKVAPTAVVTGLGAGPAKPGPRTMDEELDPGLYKLLGISGTPTVIAFRKATMRALARGDAGSIELFHRANAEMKAQGVSYTREELRLAAAK